MFDEEVEHECFKCHVSLHLADGMERPDDGVPLFCWGCQHEEIRDLVTLCRRASRAMKSNDVANRLAIQIDGYINRHGYQSSILRGKR